MQKQDPVAARNLGAGDQLGAAAFAGANDVSARCVRDFQGAVSRTAIGDDDFTHHATHRRRDQTVETAGQRTFGVEGRNDDTDHPPIMTQPGRHDKVFAVAG